MRKSDGDYAAFFEPLVGTPAAADTFRFQLAEVVRAARDKGEGADLYTWLTVALSVVADENAPRVTAGYPRLSTERIAGNVKVGGAKLTVGALRAVGNLYVRHARDEDGDPIPQRKSGVERSAAHAMGFVWSLANRSAMATATSIYAAQEGVSPNNPWRRLRYLGKQALHRPLSRNLEGAFAVALDLEGQLGLSLRHRPLRTTSGRHCPAVDVRMPNGERGLWEYLNVIGQVATDEIFPHQFTIVPDADFHEYYRPADPATSE